MSWIQAWILGLIQGLTEFFPVSSSAHLKIVKKFLSIADGEHLLFFDLVCHAGTLLALLIYLRRDIWEVLKTPRQIALYSLALAPLVPAYFLLKPLRHAASDPAYLGYCLILTAGLLFAATRKKTECRTLNAEFTGAGPLQAAASPPQAATQLQSAAELRQSKIETEWSDRARHCLESKASEEDRFFKAAASPPQAATQLQSAAELRQSKIETEWSDRAGHCLESKASEEDRFFKAAASPHLHNKKYLDVLFIGGMQALALIPGISRSGSTIAAARFRGWKWKDGARFSFLLAVPTILGGQLLETVKIVKGQSDAADVSFACYAFGFAAAFGMGMIGVRFVFWIYEKEKVRPFAWYCLGMGLLAIGIFRHG